MQVMEQIQFSLTNDDSDTMQLIGLHQRLDEAFWWLQVSINNSHALASLKAQHSKCNPNPGSRPGSTQGNRANGSDSHTFLVHLGLPLLDVVKTVAVPVDSTVNQFIEQMYAKHYAKMASHRQPSDYVLKIPGCQQPFLPGSDLLANSVSAKLASKLRIELLLLEKDDNNFVTPPALVAAEQQRVTIPEDGNSFVGTPSEQLKAFEASGKDILATMILNAGLKMTDFKELFAYDTCAKRKQALPAILKSKRPDLLPAFDCLSEIVATTFDQYEGLRQVADFRGLPDIGEVLVREGAAINIALKKMLESAQVSVLQAALDNNTVVSSSMEGFFRDACKQLLMNFHKLKIGILRYVAVCNVTLV
eukprot:TRINITY_DN8038_c0_g1_i2.p1 TRINITY_DN8038_c0_g1~~TRINITY_DN8038_c0_g1_i2.p1  ORF type:complete len:411 (+),score=-10.66 TRINITY_DN8038_c0_g1_i2:149-1234(+)